MSRTKLARSPENWALWEALQQVRLAVKPVIRDQAGDGFTYATAVAIHAEVDEALDDARLMLVIRDWAVDRSREGSHLWVRYELRLLPTPERGGQVEEFSCRLSLDLGMAKGMDEPQLGGQTLIHRRVLTQLARLPMLDDLEAKQQAEVNARNKGRLTAPQRPRARTPQPSYAGELPGASYDELGEMPAWSDPEPAGAAPAPAPAEDVDALRERVFLLGDDFAGRRGLTIRAVAEALTADLTSVEGLKKLLAYYEAEAA